jgi:hypothetical protein
MVKQQSVTGFDVKLTLMGNAVSLRGSIDKRDRNQTEIQRDGLGIIQQCGSHLLTLINDILDLNLGQFPKGFYPSDCNCHFCHTATHC